MVDGVVDTGYWLSHPSFPLPSNASSVLQRLENWKPHFTDAFTAWVLGLKYLPPNMCIYARSKRQRWRQDHLPCPCGLLYAGNEGHTDTRMFCNTVPASSLQLPGCPEAVHQWQWYFLNPPSVPWAILELKHSSDGLRGSSQLVDGFYKILGAIPIGPA